MVVTLVLIVASIATPIYQTCATRACEAVLRDHLFTLRALIDRFTLDNGHAPIRLQELVEKGYLGRKGGQEPFSPPVAGRQGLRSVDSNPKGNACQEHVKKLNLHPLSTV